MCTHTHMPIFQGGEGGGWMGMALCRLEFSRPENSRGSQLTKSKETTC